MSAIPSIFQGQSCAADEADAVREFHTAVAQPAMELVIFFCASSYDLERLASEMALRFGSVRVVGCTTAGEIGPAGMRDRGLVGASFAAGSFTVAVTCLEHLHDFQSSDGQAAALALLRELEGRDTKARAGNTFAVVLIDGLSMREEVVVRSLHRELLPRPLIGGSAGDGLTFGKTQVFFDGRFSPDAAVVVLASTVLPFHVFKTQHFVATPQRFVVTSADPEHRIVHEINGLPAAREYARLVGIDARALKPTMFATYPVVVVIDGTNYVRSIQQVNPDGSLTFFCAIENGLVLRIAHGEGLVENLERMFEEVVRGIGPPQAVLACDCILRKLEISGSGIAAAVESVLLRHHVLGFNTYGEQFQGVHVNQTLVGIAFGEQQ